MATKYPRVQVTIDPELGEAMAAINTRPRSKSKLIRDLALRGAKATAEDRQRRDEARDFLRKVVDGEIDLDFTAAREAHEEREAEVE